MIETARLTLRRVTMADLDAFHDILRRPEVMTYWSTPPHPDRATTETWLTTTVARDPATTVEFAVVLDGRVIGKVGGGALPEVGYIFHPDAWGKGYATEAMQALIAFAFAHHDIDHLMADIDPRNAASRSLLQRLGFHYTHHAANTFCINGAWSDSDYYRLNRPQTP
ncbi:MAG: GNAT family N-acetyltransferase [bacterium]